MSDTNASLPPLDDLQKFINHVRAVKKWDTVYLGAAPETYMVSMAEYALELARRLAEVEHERDEARESLNGSLTVCVADFIRTKQRAERAEAKLAEVEAANRWIPCSERMPIEGHEVLFIAEGSIELGILYGGTWTALRTDSQNDPFCWHEESILLWRPLPPAPTTDSNPAVSEEKA